MRQRAESRSRAGSQPGRGAEQLRQLIRDIPDFPQPGILFKDITPLMADPRALALAVEELANYSSPLEVDCVIAAEARGFLLVQAIALALGAGFVLEGKPGKQLH